MTMAGSLQPRHPPYRILASKQRAVRDPSSLPHNPPRVRNMDGKPRTLKLVMRGKGFVAAEASGNAAAGIAMLGGTTSRERVLYCPLVFLLVMATAAYQTLLAGQRWGM